MASSRSASTRCAAHTPARCPPCSADGWTAQPSVVVHPVDAPALARAGLRRLAAVGLRARPVLWLAAVRLLPVTTLLRVPPGRSVAGLRGRGRAAERRLPRALRPAELRGVVRERGPGDRRLVAVRPARTRRPVAGSHRCPAVRAGHHGRAAADRRDRPWGAWVRHPRRHGG